jgi:hypothetical protein
VLTELKFQAVLHLPLASFAVFRKEVREGVMRIAQSRIFQTGRGLLECSKTEVYKAPRGESIIINMVRWTIGFCFILFCLLQVKLRIFGVVSRRANQYHFIGPMLAFMGQR